MLLRRLQARGERANSEVRAERMSIISDDSSWKPGVQRWSVRSQNNFQVSSWEAVF